jgi:hypothetical protein
MKAPKQRQEIRRDPGAGDSSVPQLVQRDAGWPCFAALEEGRRWMNYGRTRHGLLVPWKVQEGRLQADDVARRINFLVANVLRRAASRDGWTVLY